MKPMIAIIMMNRRSHLQITDKSQHGFIGRGGGGWGDFGSSSDEYLGDGSEPSDLGVSGSGGDMTISGGFGMSSPGGNGLGL